jgi:hypothetical protein
VSVLPASANRQVAEVAIARAAEATGVDFTMLMETARRESGFNPRAKAPTSSATGLFQFIEQTWLEMVRRHGAKHGLSREAGMIDVRGGRSVVSDPAQRRAILELRNDPELSARMAGELAKENGARLAQRLGRDPAPGELYAAHVLGAAGAARLIEAAATGAPNAGAIFPREAAANRWLFNDKSGAPRSAQALLARLDIAAEGARLAPPTTPSVVNIPDSPMRTDAATPRLDNPEHLAALVELLFAAAGLGAFRDQDRRTDPMSALQAYARWNKP